MRKPDPNQLLKRGLDPEEIDDMLDGDDEKPVRTREPRVDRDRHKFNPRRPTGRRPTDE